MYCFLLTQMKGNRIECQVGRGTVNRFRHWLLYHIQQIWIIPNSLLDLNFFMTSKTNDPLNCWWLILQNKLCCWGKKNKRRWDNFAGWKHLLVSTHFLDLSNLLKMTNWLGCHKRLLKLKDQRTYTSKLLLSIFVFSSEIIIITSTLLENWKSCGTWK